MDYWIAVVAIAVASVAMVLSAATMLLNARLAGRSETEGLAQAAVVTACVIAEWLRSDEAERIRAAAILGDVPPEDALADGVERRFGGAA